MQEQGSGNPELCVTASSARGLLWHERNMSVGVSTCPFLRGARIEGCRADIFLVADYILYGVKSIQAEVRRALALINALSTRISTVPPTLCPAENAQLLMRRG